MIDVLNVAKVIFGILDANAFTSKIPKFTFALETKPYKYMDLLCFLLFALFFVKMVRFCFFAFSFFSFLKSQMVGFALCFLPYFEKPNG